MDRLKDLKFDEKKDASDSKESELTKKGEPKNSDEQSETKNSDEQSESEPDTHSSDDHF